MKILSVSEVLLIAYCVEVVLNAMIGKFKN